MSTNITSTEYILRDRLESFTDREAILTQFAHSLQSAQPGQFQLLAIKGNSGTGKTFLIDYLRTHLPTGWQVGQLAFAQSIPDFRPILEDLEDGLKGCVPPSRLQQYREQREAYKRRFDEYRATITISQRVEAREQSRISNIQQSVQVNPDELRRRELQLRAELTRALLELAEACQQPLCFFIDGYERLAETDPELVGWLWEEVLLKLARRAPKPFLVVTCGWLWPDNAAITPFSHNQTLDDFDESRVSSYLHKQGVLPDAPVTPAQQALLSVFYELSRGHPLVLALAVTYFQTLSEPERTAASLHANRRLVDDKVRVEWLNERLLNRLSEPYRTLLERGPILRFFDQGVLRALLSVKIDSATTIDSLNDRAYERFLQYPFINRESVSGDALLSQPTFHELVRRVRLESLRLYPETKELLHRAMAGYYTRIIDEEQRQAKARAKPRLKLGLFQKIRWWLQRLFPKMVRDANVFTADYSEWFVEISEQAFNAQVEYFYHALQVSALQAEAFETWAHSVEWAVDRWRHRQAWPLLEVVRQLIEEEVPFLDRNHYVRYLVWYSRFLKQQARWEEARAELEEALQFGHRGDEAAIASILDEIGAIYRQEGKLEEALNYHKRALALLEQVGDSTYIAHSLDHIGTTYWRQGKLEEALSYHKRALALLEQVGNPADIASSLNEIGVIYYEQRKLEEALRYFERSLSFKEKVRNSSGIATSLNNIGNIYLDQGKPREALRYHERALALREPLRNPDAIAQSLGNIGRIYSSQGKIEEGLRYLERALALQEQVGNPAVIAVWLHNIGTNYAKQGKIEEALSYFERTLAIEEPLGNLDAIATTLNSIGNTYRIQGKVEEALHYYERALALREQVGRSVTIAESLYSIGETYREQGKLEEALRYYERVLDLKGPIDNLAAIATSFSNIGDIYRRQGNLEQALNSSERALAIEEPLGNLDAIAISLNNIGVIYAEQGELEQALSYYERALALREQVGSLSSTAESLHNIANIYYQQEMWEQAITYYSQSGSLYERLGSGFESDVADELEELSNCYYALGELEKAFPYSQRAQYIRQRLQKQD